MDYSLSYHRNARAEISFSFRLPPEAAPVAVAVEPERRGHREGQDLGGVAGENGLEGALSKHGGHDEGVLGDLHGERLRCGRLPRRPRARLPAHEMYRHVIY